MINGEMKEYTGTEKDALIKKIEIGAELEEVQEMLAVLIEKVGGLAQELLEHKTLDEWGMPPKMQREGLAKKLQSSLQPSIENSEFVERFMNDKSYD